MYKRQISTDRENMDKQILRVLQAAVLAAGAPVGWFMIQAIFIGQPMNHLSSNLWLYTYMWLGTSISYIGFAAYVGSQEEKYRALSIHDSLTNLYNRRFFNAQIKRQVAIARRNHIPLSLVVLDIDLFKQINDKYGHQIGDEVIRSLAKWIQVHVRETDIAARVGGEEFAILLQPSLADDAFDLAERLRKHVASQKLKFGANSISVSVSIGVATLADEHDFNEDKLFASADEALYLAKELGRNKTIAYNTEHAIGTLETA